MFRFVAFGSIVLALALCLTHARAQIATTAPASASSSAPTTTAPTTVPDPLVDNPHYRAWAKYKPGTQVGFAMNVTAGGQQAPTNVTLTLSEITPERAIVQSVAIMSLPGLPAQETEQTHTFNAIVPESQAQRADRPPSGIGETRDAGTETIEAAGTTYETTIIEFDGTVQKASAESKTWRSDAVPGGLVKRESITGNTTVQMILTKVTIK